MHATGNPEVRSQTRVENRNPVQPSQQLFRTAEQGRWIYILMLNVEIRLVGFVEQDQRISACLRKAVAYILMGALKNGDSFTATGTLALRLTCETNLR